MFWQLDLATCWQLTLVAKNACLAKIGAVFKSFSVFPRTFCDYSSSLSTVSFPIALCNHFQTPLLLPFSSKSSSNKYGFSFLNSILLDCVLFPLDYSHLFMFLRWVFVSAVALCPCLACGCYWFSLILIKLLVLFFIMCLARVCYLLVTHLVWSYVDVLIQNVPVLTVRFTVLNICLSIYCVHLSFVLWVMSYSSICMSH